jgi:hypothetical protein
MSSTNISRQIDESPDEAIAIIRRQRAFRLVLVLVALLGALGVAIATTLLMYAEEPQAVQSLQTP